MKCSVVTTAYISPIERKAPKIKYKATPFANKQIKAMHAAKNVTKTHNQKYFLSTHK